MGSSPGGKRSRVGGGTARAWQPWQDLKPRGCKILSEGVPLLSPVFSSQKSRK